MAGKSFIADIKDRDRIVGSFLVQQKQVPLNKNGKPYIAVVVMDRTGSIEGRVWDNVDKFVGLFEAGDFIDVKGVAVSYQNRLQLKIETIARLDPETVDLEEFLPTTARDRGEMLNRVKELLESIGNQQLVDLLVSRLDNPEFRQQFARAPAAKTIHHAFLGGLLEHTLAVMELADRVSGLYPHIDRDILIAGAFLHDIGKVAELSVDAAFEYTDEGRLLGHIVMGAMMFEQWASDHGELDEEIVLRLSHMILSHHGSYEFGSPKRPKFTEALVLNYLDEMDSKIQTFKEIAQRDSGNRWSTFQRVFDRYLLLGTGGEENPKQERDTADNRPERGEKKDRRDSPLKHRAFAEQLAGKSPGAKEQRREDGQQMSLVTPGTPSKREK